MAHQLEKSNDERVIKPLVAYLNGSDANTRQHMAAWLLTIHNPLMVGPLTVLVSDPDPFVRETAARALSAIDGHRAATY
jgi:HEAT repeat protein